jgi:glycosyltransferase involved in cell wall biosynthesis
MREKELMHIHIAYEFKGPMWGGGNQFLLALREEFEKRGVYADSVNDADVVLFNSFHLGQWLPIKVLSREKRRRPELIVVHRVDGPFSLVRSTSSWDDRIVTLLNLLLADATVFQSNWSRAECQAIGIGKNHMYTTILNAAGADFSPATGVVKLRHDEKVRVVSSGWSTNPNKGFADLEWLDSNLDFSRYEFTYFGNCPINFKNLRLEPPLNALELASNLRNYDIYFSGARNEPCSNALLEGMASGLPALAYHGGGNPQIVKSGGLTYHDVKEVPALLDKISEKLDEFRAVLPQRAISNAADQYLEFFDGLVAKASIRSSAKTFFAELMFGSRLGSKLLVLRQKVLSTLSGRHS